MRMSTSEKMFLARRDAEALNMREVLLLLFLAHNPRETILRDSVISEYMRSRGMGPKPIEGAALLPSAVMEQLMAQDRLVKKGMLPIARQMRLTSYGKLVVRVLEDLLQQAKEQRPSPPELK